MEVNIVSYKCKLQYYYNETVTFSLLTRTSDLWDGYNTTAMK